MSMMLDKACLSYLAEEQKLGYLKEKLTSSDLISKKVCVKYSMVLFKSKIIKINESLCLSSLNKSLFVMKFVICIKVMNKRLEDNLIIRFLSNFVVFEFDSRFKCGNSTLTRLIFINYSRCSCYYCYDQRKDT